MVKSNVFNGHNYHHSWTFDNNTTKYVIIKKNIEIIRKDC